MTDEKNTTPAHLDFIDSLRGLASLMVVVSHSWISTNRFKLELGGANVGQHLALGSLGVNLFMVISGFCLALPLVGRDSIAKLDVRRFAVRRLWRVLPAYYASLGLFSLLGLVAPTLYASVGASVAPTFTVPTLQVVAAHAFFIRNALAGAGIPLPTINGTFWSLELEMQFYVAFPVLVWLARRYGVQALGAAALTLTAAWRTYVWDTHRAGDFVRLTTLSWCGPGRLFEFALGMIAAVIFVRQRDRLRPWPLFAVSVVAITLARNLAAHVGQFAPVPDLVYAIGFFFFVLATGASATFARSIGGRALKLVGMASYSIYLVHGPVMEQLYRFFPNRDGMEALLVYTLCFTCVSVVLSFLFFYGIENPMLRFAKRRGTAR